MTQKIKRADDAVKWLTSRPADGVSLIFGAMARLRRAPAVHPRGMAFAAQLTVSDQTPLILQGDHPATVKLSKGAGTPGQWPDILGLALRIHPTDTNRPSDFLFSSAGDGRWTRWLPIPARDWSRTHYGTLAPYESAGRWSWLMLTPSGPPTGHASIHELQQTAPTGFNLHISGEGAVWKHIGRLDLQTRLDDDALVFDPVLNHPVGAVPAPRWLRELRELAYDGSRQGRGGASPPHHHGA